MDEAKYIEMKEQATNDEFICENVIKKECVIETKSGGESLTPQVRGASAEHISDDQELFLKVLENLKNAVNAKPDHHAVPLSKNLNKTPISIATKDLSNESENSESLQPALVKCDQNNERGTTKLTVSDKTKSLILQKLAVTSEIEKMKSNYSATLVIDYDDASNSSDKSHGTNDMGNGDTNHHNVEVLKTESNNKEGVTLTVMGFDNVSQKVTEKDVLISRLINKENVDKSFEKVVHVASISSNQKQVGRLIAPATPSVQLFTCTFCDYYSENKSYLKQHIDLVHNNDRPYKCSYCDYAGKRIHALREHLIVHSNDRPFQCKSCNATFRKKGHLTNHIKLHNSKRLVKCPLCKVLVYDTGENGLDAHLKNDHDTERLYGCDLCDHVAANEPGILKHLNEKHKSRVSSHKCDKCPFETANIIDFNAHATAHNITEGKVHIGNTVPTEVVGVATVPTGSHEFGITNTSVSFNANDAKKQPAVIKPVWIKCSECGFTGQDSEVIKKHMLEHLNQDYGDNYQHVQQYFNTVKTSAARPHGAVTPPKPESTKTSAPASNMKTPILVPVTSVEQLFPQHAGKLDMNSPILVPVTDPSMLKSLQSVSMSSYQYSPTKAPAKYVRLPDNAGLAQTTVERSLYIPEIMKNYNTAKTPQTSQHNVLYPIEVAPNAAVKAETFSEASTTLPINTSNNFLTAPKQQVITLQREQMQQLLRNPHLKVVPVTASQNVGIPVQTTTVTRSINQATPRIVSLSNKVSVKSGTVSINQQIATLSNAAVTPVSTNITLTKPTTIVQVPAPLNLTQIPIPRMLSTNAPPRLPPEIIQLAPMSIVEEEPEAVHNIREPEQEPTQEEKLAALRESLANVTRLIEQQDKLNRQIGNTALVRLDSKGIPEKNSGQKVIYCMTPVAKQNTLKRTENAGFTHDSNAGRFRCTLCGYTCEYQRTIKAHIWKHSGNKDIDYPMFQNGPLSIYEDGQLAKVESDDNAMEQIMEQTSAVAPLSLPPGFKMINQHSILDSEAASLQQPGGKMPSFIVYEQTKISNVAPALAQLIAARTMVGLNEIDNIETTNNNTTDANTKEKENVKLNDDVGIMVNTEQNNAFQEEGSGQRLKTNTKKVENDCRTKKINVVVEAIDSVAGSSDFTGMQSQQNSPRIMAPKSPDSGVSDMTSTTKNADERSVSSGFVSPIPNFDVIADEESTGGLRRSKRRIQSLELDKSSEERTSDGGSSAKKVKITQTREDSAVTLLSLLKKGPNYNPACPPKHGQVLITSGDMSEAPSPSGQDDSNSVGESDMSSSKPKSGISTSLLAVIEQLRERSKSDFEDEKPPIVLQTKKQSKRRSRKSSLEDNAPANDIDNVEEFVSEGEIKFRCKLCHYTNDSTVLLRQHMRLHKPKQEFECSLCDHIAESSEALQDHMIQHCKIRTYQCKQCASAFNYKSQLRAHMRMHNDQDILLCDFCDFESRSASSLKVHMKSHLTKPPYKCELCKEEFLTSFNLRVHKREGCYTSIDNVGNFKCDECEYTSLGRREMKNHQKGHMGRSTVQAPKKCPYCEQTELTIDMVQQHISDVHGESKPLKCEMCGFVAVSIRSLKSHMKRHVNDQRFVAQPLEQYKCNLCGYVCHHLPSLKSHMWRHAADQHYSYEFTNDVINAAIDFDSHTDAVDTTHEHVENFKKFIYDKMKSKGLENTHGTQEESAMACCWVTFRCCQCGFETINKAELNMHMTTHSDVIKWTLDVPDEEGRRSKQSTQILNG